MVTKGVASVPSPVKNLREFSAAVDHEQFVQVVADEFAAAYGLSRDIQVSLVSSSPLSASPGPNKKGDETELTVLPGAQRVDASEADRNEYVRAVVEELKVRVTSPGVSGGISRRITFPVCPRTAQSWEWQYGQTPEFTHVISGTLSFGPLVRFQACVVERKSARCGESEHHPTDPPRDCLRRAGDDDPVPARVDHARRVDAGSSRGLARCCDRAVRADGRGPVRDARADERGGRARWVAAASRADERGDRVVAA